MKRKLRDIASCDILLREQMPRTFLIQKLDIQSGKG